MELKREASCGSDERSDAWVNVRPADTISVRIDSKTGPMYEERIREMVEGTLRELGVTGAEVEVREQGAYDHVIRARLLCALRRACDGNREAFLRPVSLAVERKGSPKGRLRRSRLYVPGNNARVLAFADTFEPDCIILDLEDSVPPNEKDAARFLVREVLASLDFKDTEVWVRINPLSRGGREDLEVVLPGRPHGICLPKAESPVEVAELAGLLYELEGRYGIPWLVWIMPIIESPKGVLAAPEIARASERVVCLAFGAEDYIAELGCGREWEALLWARSRIVAAAAAAGIQASDTVFPDVEDEEGLLREALRAKALGFSGKGAIHPLQLEAIHRAFAPTPEEISWAQGVMRAAEEAERRGMGVVTYEGKMVDRPVVLRAKRILEMARVLGTEVGDGA